jgi:hypothetical protein
VGTGEEHFTTDKFGRDNYIFAGYVFRNAKFDRAIPRNPKLFVSLFSYVVSNWTQKIGAVEVQFDMNIDLGDDTESSQESPHSLVLNSDRQEICIRPVGAETDLWNSAFQHDGDIAVCLGIPNRRYAVSSAFTEASFDGCERTETLPRR